MKRITAGLLSMVMLILTACANQSSNPNESVTKNMNTSSQDTSIAVENTKAAGKSKKKPGISQTGLTTAVPAAYKSQAKNLGKVVSLDYTTKNYAGDDEEVSKTAYVYLPYGYDEKDTKTKYDIIYLMHGWGGRAGEYFAGSIKNMLDNLIEKGDIKPIIAVSPSFYNDNTDTDFSSSVSALRQFHKEFENELMPAVEGKYRTYAKGTTKKELAASHDHRAFGGFSLGSVTTWMQFVHNNAYISKFLPMSGSSWYYGGYGDFRIKQNADHIEKVVKDNKLNKKGYFIYLAVGTNDSVKSQTIDFANELLSRKNKFTPEHFVFYQKDGGYHDFDAVQEFMYNALPVFFPGKGKAG